MKVWAKTDGEVREGKFLVVRRDGTVPAWPHFVMGARDPAVPYALRAYADQAKERGYDPEYVDSVRQLASDFAQYRHEHGAGDPDKGPHRKDDPNVIRAMRHEMAIIVARPSGGTFATAPGFVEQLWVDRERMTEERRDPVAAIEAAGFRVSLDLEAKPTLWCKECQRDSGFHYHTCSKSSAGALSHRLEEIEKALEETRNRTKDLGDRIEVVRTVILGASVDDDDSLEDVARGVMAKLKALETAGARAERAENDLACTIASVLGAVDDQRHEGAIAAGPGIPLADVVRKAVDVAKGNGWPSWAGTHCLMSAPAGDKGCCAGHITACECPCDGCRSRPGAVAAAILRLAEAAEAILKHNVAVDAYGCYDLATAADRLRWAADKLTKVVRYGIWATPPKGLLQYTMGNPRLPSGWTDITKNDGLTWERETYTSEEAAQKKADSYRGANGWTYEVRKLPAE